MLFEESARFLSILVNVFNSDLPEKVIFSLWNGTKYPKNFDLGFFAPLAMRDIFPLFFVKTSAIILVVWLLHSAELNHVPTLANKIRLQIWAMLEKVLEESLTGGVNINPSIEFQGNIHSLLR